MDRHILLVDDDEDMLLMVGRWLSKSYQVDTASSGMETLAALQDTAYDLVLLDYSMPQLDGAATLKKIREELKLTDLRVVFLTGMEDADVETGVRDLHPTGFWQKSMGKKGLLAEVEKLFMEA